MLTFGTETARFLGAFNMLGLEKLALIRTACHVAEVLAEVVHASRAPTQESSGHHEVGFKILKLLRTATKMEVTAEVVAKVRTGLIEDRLVH